MNTEFPNVNALWSYVLVETLARKGVRHAVICPGSRSSPLAFAFSQCEQIEAIPVLDERSAAFFAMGLAKYSGVPAALVCTSGTAAANFFPAVIEASESGVPLIVLTADRPPEMRQCSAGQTIDQVKLYGNYAQAQIDLALPESGKTMLRYLRETASYFFEQSIGGGRGPVHMNIPFRDPLPPILESGFASEWDGESLERLLAGVAQSGSVEVVRSVDLSDFVDTDRGVLIVGPHSPVDAAAWVAGVCALAKRLAWPVLCDGLSPLRSAGTELEWVMGYDSIFRSKAFLEMHLPAKAIVVGELPTSKMLRTVLAKADLELLFLSRLDRNLDPTYARSTQIAAAMETDRFVFKDRERGDYFAAWQKAESLALSFFDKKMEATEELFEGKVASVLSESLQVGASVLVSNGMPPRDCEFFWKRGGGKQKVFFNRGVNGIDGVLSTAVGLAYAGEPTVLVIGDLALLHDTNGALLRRALKGSLTIVLINNAGGGIFEMLPVAKFGQTFETFFACDQDIENAQWARTYGIGYEAVTTWSELSEGVKILPQSGMRLLEIKTDRKADAAARKSWFAALGEALDAAFG